MTGTCYSIHADVWNVFYGIYLFSNLSKCFPVLSQYKRCWNVFRFREIRLAKYLWGTLDKIYRLAKYLSLASAIPVISNGGHERRSVPSTPIITMKIFLSSSRGEFVGRMGQCAFHIPGPVNGPAKNKTRERVSNPYQPHPAQDQWSIRRLPSSPN